MSGLIEVYLCLSSLGRGCGGGVFGGCPFARPSSQPLSLNHATHVVHHHFAVLHFAQLCLRVVNHVHHAVVGCLHPRQPPQRLANAVGLEYLQSLDRLRRQNLAVH